MLRCMRFFSCVDCGREFQTREELEDHESISLNSIKESDCFFLDAY